MDLQQAVCLPYLLAVMFSSPVLSTQVTSKIFYLGIQEIYWDYTPRGSSKAKDRKIYKKAVYKEYTDDTFTTEKIKPKWQGFIGPSLYVEADDWFKVTLFNNASHPFSFHPHGVLYSKQFEGALYADGSHLNASQNLKDIVQPGETYTYLFVVNREASPAKNDPGCLTWLYHSHVDTIKDVNSGLVGMLLTCKKGTLKKNRGRHYSLYAGTVEEKQSWYKEENKKLNSKIERLSMINGYMFGQIPDLEACVGEKVTWHMSSLGTLKDIHALSISGHTFEYFHSRKITINLDPSRFGTATTVSHKSGKWLISCRSHEWANQGMYGYFNVKKCPNRLRPSHQHIKKVRWHYIAAEEVLWNYGPTGKNLITGECLTKPGSDSEKYFKHDKRSIGGTYKKAVFRAYDDYHFKTKKIQDDRPEHLGILGPVIRAEVGDLIQIVFKNKASRPYSLHAEGVMFSKRSEGMSYKDDDGSQYVSDNAVDPGKTYTYFWYITEDMSPTEADPQCLTRRYISGVDPVKDQYSGLIGPLLVCKPGTLDRNGSQKSVDKEFFLMTLMFDENLSWYLDENIALAGVDKSVKGKNSNVKGSINGLMYGNLRGLDMCVGDSVAWHVFGEGSMSDVHSYYFHGNSFRQTTSHHNSAGMLPGERKTLYMNPDVPGEWKLDCAVFGHALKGEVTSYKVSNCSARSPPSAKLPKGMKRVFYIQAEEVEWDYAPSGRNLIFNKTLDQVYDYRKFIKVVYRGYTDDTFSTRLNRTGQEYLGIQGPLIRVEVRDTLKVVFRNKGPRPFSFHPQRLNSRHGTRRQDEPPVAPGKTFIYEWTIRADEGPGEHDLNCVNSPYYSAVNVKPDTHTGMIGTLVICRPGILDKDGARTDVDREFSVFFSIFLESQGWMWDKNVERAKKATGKYPHMTMYSINGFIFGNQPPPTMLQFERVDWYLMTFGNHYNIHPTHFHGNDVYVNEGLQHISDVSEIMTGNYNTVRMHTVNPGKWLYHCHINIHIAQGMESFYKVLSYK